MLLAVAWSLAELTWRVVPGGTTEVGRSPTPTAVRQVRNAAPKLAPVADLSLFGKPESTVATGGPVDAPETRLNLILRGVLATGSPYARAIVSAAGGDELSYRVGDHLPGGATLDQVLADRVILQRAGRFEALYLPKEADAGSNMSSFERSGPDLASPSSDVSAQLQDVRQRILDDPSQAFSFARVQPVMEGGKLKGYRLSPNRERQLFRQLGLRPGDVVTSVNGIALDDPATVGMVLTQLTNAPELTLTLDRGGRQETVVVSLGQ
jgi:general secretion pathway protein C